MFKTCLENRIIRHEEDYKCYLCHCEIKQSFDSVEEHLLTDKHKERFNQMHEKQRKSESDTLVEFPESQLRIVVENRITFDRLSVLFYCHACKSVIGDLCSALVHVREVSHRSALQKFEADLKANASKRSSKNITAIPKSKSSNSQASISDVQSQSSCISFDEKTNTYYCNICKSTITQDRSGLSYQVLELGLTNQDSSSKLECVIYDKKCNLYYCATCVCQIYGTENVLGHVKGYLHQTMSRTQSSLVKKGIEVASQEFASQVVFEAQEALKAKEIESSMQKSLVEESSLESCFSEISCCVPCQAFLENHTETQYHVTLHLYKEFKLLNNFDILELKTGTNGNYYLKCLLCDFYCVSGMSNLYKFMKIHFETGKHHERIKFLKLSKNDLALEDKTEKINSLVLNKFTYSTVDSISPGLLCNICNVPVPCTSEHPGQHISGKTHNKNLSKCENGEIIEKQAGFNAKKDDSYYMCFMCNKSFRKASILLEHYNTTEHGWKIELFRTIKKCSYTNFQTFNKTEVIRCSLCNILFYDSKSVVEHITGKKHNEKLTLMSANQEKKKKIAIPLAELTHELQHLNVNASKKLSRKQRKIAASVKNQNSIVTTTNLKQIKKANNLETTIVTKTVQPVSALEPDKVASVLDNLVPLDFSKTQVNRLPILAKAKLPRTPKGNNNQQNSFATNVLLNGKQYIKFCIDSGPENIYNFDNEKISLLNIGVSLTAPHCSERVCFPCGQQFPNDVQSLFEHLQKQEHLNSIYEMQVEDKSFENCPEQFSHLRLAQLYMHESDQGIQCHACNIEVDDKDENIRQHAEQLAHKEKTILWKQQSEQLFNQYLTIYKDIWYYAEVFFCEICKKKYDFEIDFIKHLINPDHMKKVNDLKYKGVALTFDLCPSCITYWFGNTNSYEIHCKSNFHKRFAKNKDFMVPNLTVNASEFLDNIDDNIGFLESESNKANLEKDKEMLLLNAIEETVKPKYSNAKAYTFGSRLSHLGFPSSDLDVFLDCENVYYTSSSKEQSQQYIKSIKAYFERASKVWVVDEVLLTSRVPIMKLRHMPTNLKCDISFINGLSVEKSKLVGLYNVAFPICRKLILFMKKWLTLCRLFGSNCITTFAISWCVIFYLQLQGILPTVFELIKRENESKIIDGWQCGFVETLTAEDSNLSFKEHLKGFFTYFANFDYQTSVICPFLGKTINKHAFAYTNKLPTEMDIYKNRLKNKDVEIFRFDSPMCIQDPIDLSQNMTKAVKKQHLRCFRQYCILSADKC